MVSSIGAVHREDHVWYEIRGGKHDGKHKCCLCGGIATKPPPYPTPPNWIPEEYELPLTDVEKRMCVNPSTKKTV